MRRNMYTFHPEFIKGLKQPVTLFAYNYPEARKRVLKCLYTGRDINVCLLETETFLPKEYYDKQR